MSVTDFSSPCLLSSLIESIDTLPLFPRSTNTPAPRKRGRVNFYQDRLFLKALVIMVVRRLTSVHELLEVVQQPTPAMQKLRSLLCFEGHFPSRRTWERRLKAMPATLEAQVAVLGRFLVDTLDPFARSGRAVAVDSTLLRAFGGFCWHKKDRLAGQVPHSGIDIEAAWGKSGHHGWVYGWKLHLVATCGEVWIPLGAQVTPANQGDGEVALSLMNSLPHQVRFVLGDTHYNTPL